MDRPRRAQNHHHDRGQPYNDPSHDENLKRHRRGLIIPENFTFRVLPDLRKILTAARASEHGNISRKNSDNAIAMPQFRGWRIRHQAVLIVKMRHKRNRAKHQSIRRPCWSLATGPCNGNGNGNGKPRHKHKRRNPLFKPIPLVQVHVF